MSARSLFSEEAAPTEDRLTLNLEYAHKFKEKKKHEELVLRVSLSLRLTLVPLSFSFSFTHRRMRAYILAFAPSPSLVEAKYGAVGEKAEEDEDESDEPEDEDETAVADTATLQEGFLRVMPLLHRRDPQVYDSRVRFFPQGEEEQARREFAEAAAAAPGGGEGEDDFIRLRHKTAEEKRAEDAAYQEWTQSRGRREGREGGGGGGSAGGASASGSSPSCGDAILMRYWKEDANLDEGERFLRRYIWDRLWLEDDSSAATTSHSSGSAATAQGDVDDDAEDSELEREEFERRYNFRFEDPDGAKIAQHPRQVEGSMRVDKRAEARAERRRARKERKEREKLERQEELQRLRQLQKERILEQLAKIKDTLGASDLSDLPIDPRRIIEEDYDPETWDSRMSAMFGDTFYRQRDPTKPAFEEDPFIDSTKPLGRPDTGSPPLPPQPPPQPQPDAEAEDPVVKEALDSGTLLVGKHLKKKQKRKQEAAAAESEAAETEPKPEPELDPVAAKERARKLIDQYYALDFEDIVGGVPCRFKYQEIKPDRRGLSVEDVLMCDDHVLRKIMPLYRYPKAVRHKGSGGATTTKAARNRRLPLHSKTQKLLLKKKKKSQSKAKAKGKSKQKKSKTPPATGRK